MITQKRLKELLHYDPITGLFTWLVANSNRVKVGDVAGALGDHGRILIRVDGVLYKAHRLAWLYMTGKWPNPEADHEDTDASNNKWLNLREANRSQNNCNKKNRKDNTSGYKGVYQDKRRSKWMARINGKFLGYFNTSQGAHAAYCAAAQKYHGQFARTT